MYQFISFAFFAWIRRQDLVGYLRLFSLSWPLFKINSNIAFGLALQAGIPHGCQPVLRLAIIFKPAILHRLMKALAQK